MILEDHESCMDIYGYTMDIHVLFMGIHGGAFWIVQARISNDIHELDPLLSTDNSCPLIFMDEREGGERGRGDSTF